MRMKTRPRFLWVGLAALSLLFLLGACGSSDTNEDGSTAAGSGAESYNEADVEFLQGMVPHHEEAIAMAEMVEGQTDRPELNELADNIIDSQSKEIEELNSMLEEAGEDSGDGGHDMDDMGDMGSMDMGMSEQEMNELMSAEGAEFDKVFSEMMIGHHEEAISMSEEVLDAGESADVATMAQGIIDEQQSEIDQLNSWLKEWDL